MVLLKNLPKEEWRLPAPSEPERQVDAFKVLCNVRDDAAKTKAILARISLSSAGKREAEGVERHDLRTPYSSSGKTSVVKQRGGAELLKSVGANLAGFASVTCGMYRPTEAHLVRSVF